MRVKLLAIWNILKGNPVIYRAIIDGAIISCNNKPLIISSEFKDCTLSSSEVD